ncbi:hypothetical protein GCM10028857_05090 [Salinarchaeum chitinilyticum]
MTLGNADAEAAQRLLAWGLLVVSIIGVVGLAVAFGTGAVDAAELGPENVTVTEETDTVEVTVAFNDSIDDANATVTADLVAPDGNVTQNMTVNGSAGGTSVQSFVLGENATVGNYSVQFAGDPGAVDSYSAESAQTESGAVGGSGAGLLEDRRTVGGLVGGVVIVLAAFGLAWRESGR